MVDRLPLHTGSVNDEPVRFYTNPKDLCQYPWHAHNDLMKAMGFPPELRIDILGNILREYPARIARIATAEGPLMICDNTIALALFQGLALHDVDTTPALAAYCEAHAEAIGQETRFMGDVWRAVWLENARRYDGGGEAMTPTEERAFRQAIAGEKNPWKPGGSRYGMPVGIASRAH